MTYNLGMEATRRRWRHVYERGSMRARRTLES
ncbi:MAG: hypothetical protein JWP73_2864 [Phenylobacterium sp.]|nr:hypothetical protein [Phenylobacterium sp.]